MDAFDLSNQRIAISGAAGGIGQETAKLVAGMGADVMLRVPSGTKLSELL